MTRSHWCSVALALGVAACAACAVAGSAEPPDPPAPPDAADDDDDPPLPPPPPPADAAPAQAGAIGQVCTGSGQGTCPPGYACLNLAGGGTPWCGLPCATHAACDASYGGPGMALCLLDIDDGGDGTVDFRSCVIMCLDGSGTGTCPPGTCTGACPPGLACTDTGVGWSMCR